MALFFSHSRPEPIFTILAGGDEPRWPHRARFAQFISLRFSAGPGLWLLGLTSKKSGIWPSGVLPPRGEGGRTPSRISRNGSGLGEFADVVGGTWRGAGFDVAVLAGLGQSDSENEEPEEGLRQDVTERIHDLAGNFGVALVVDQ